MIQGTCLDNSVGEQSATSRGGPAVVDFLALISIEPGFEHSAVRDWDFAGQHS